MTSKHEQGIEAAARAMRERTTWPSMHWPNISGVNHIDTSTALTRAAVSAYLSVVLDETELAEVIAESRGFGSGWTQIPPLTQDAYREIARAVISHLQERKDNG